LFGRLLLFLWIKPGQLARQTGPLLALAEQVHGRLQRAASAWIPAFANPPVEIRDGALIQRDGDFLSHVASMTKTSFRIPPNAPTGSQPVVVTVGGMASAPVTLNVTAAAQ
jgi:hypothetical protein